MKTLLIAKWIGLFLSSLLLTNCAGQTVESTNSIPETVRKQDDTLTIWWNRSYYLQEDEALEEVIAAWQRKTGKKIDFSIVSNDDLLKNTEKALKAGNPPDIVFASNTIDTIVPRWAWNGKLADVSDVVESLKDVYSSTAIKSVSLYNKVAQKRSIYAVPIKQQTLHVHYWRDLLTEAGLTEEDIPREWDAFWDFWKQAQDNLRAKGQTDIYALGFPMSREANDTHFTFEQILEAYDVQLLDTQGNLRLEDSQILPGIVTALKWYTDLYKEGYVPPEADNWVNRSNNTEFLNRYVLMTANSSLSIPGSQREEEEIYYNQIATISLPEEPDGEGLNSIVIVKQVMLFESSSNQEAAKEFLTYLLQPENLSSYLEESLGRYFPVMPKLASEPFWNDPADPHISKATQQFQGQTRSTYLSLNPAYAMVQSQSIWGRAIERVIVEGASPEEAAEEALNQIEEIFGQWDR